MTIQLDITEIAEEEELRQSVVKNKEQINNLRRGLFARYDKLVNELTSLQENIKEINEHLNINRCDNKIINLK